jgi:hypothetical protein
MAKKIALFGFFVLRFPGLPPVYIDFIDNSLGKCLCLLCQNLKERQLLYFAVFSVSRFLRKTG